MGPDPYLVVADDVLLLFRLVIGSHGAAPRRRVGGLDRARLADLRLLRRRARNTDRGGGNCNDLALQALTPRRGDGGSDRQEPASDIRRRKNCHRVTIASTGGGDAALHRSALHTARREPYSPPKADFQDPAA